MKGIWCAYFSHTALFTKLHCIALSTTPATLADDMAELQLQIADGEANISAMKQRQYQAA